MTIGEKIAWQINQWFPRLSIHKDLEKAKSSERANQEWAYAEFDRIVQYFEPYWSLEGKNVLDIGAGLGGKLPYLIEKAGAEAVTSIDINLTSLNIANQYIHSSGYAGAKHSQIRIAGSDAASLPFANGEFDCIVSINTFEHIASLNKAIQDTYRVLKSGGLAYLHLPPYYSPWGPHLENWIHFPWPHLFFSDRTLLQIAKREDQAQNLNQQFVSAAQIDWDACGDIIPDVNKVTLRQFRNMIRAAGFSIKQLVLLPVGYDTFNKSGIRQLFYRLLVGLSHIPGIQEIIVTKMVYVLEKRSK